MCQYEWVVLQVQENTKGWIVVSLPIDALRHVLVPTICVGALLLSEAY
jgi:hypothetical protein